MNISKEVGLGKSRNEIFAGFNPCLKKYGIWKHVPGFASQSSSECLKVSLFQKGNQQRMLAASPFDWYFTKKSDITQANKRSIINRLYHLHIGVSRQGKIRVKKCPFLYNRHQIIASSMQPITGRK